MPKWEFRAGFKHLMVGHPRRSLCSQADPDLVNSLIVQSQVPVPDVATCWLCLAVSGKDEP